MKLSSKEKQHYFSLKKGYEGEVFFDSLTEKLQCECLILNDLFLEVGRTAFQIDTLILMQRGIYFYEVKNFEGDYYYESESDRFFQKPKIERLNPLHQMERGSSLLRQLLNNLRYNFPIDPSVVFINSNFTLYQAPLDKPLIFPTQVKNYLSLLNASPSKITNNDIKLADTLISLHKTDNPYKRIPAYNYDKLRKGINCLKCSSFSVIIKTTKCVCRQCGYEEKVVNAVLRSIEEFKTLFPNERITTNIIFNWCKIIKSKKRINRILSSNFNIKGSRQWAYYE